MIQVSHIDHLVLTVADIERTADFYQEILGMEKVFFANDRIALAFGKQKINLHQMGNEYEPKATNVVTGGTDLCLIVSTPIQEVKSHLSQKGIDILEGPVDRTGAMGKIISLYFRDPDLNLIEVANYK